MSAENASSKKMVRRAQESARRSEAKERRATPARKGKARREPVIVERREKQRRKAAPKKMAGGAIAYRREQSAKDGSKNPELMTQYRKLEEMDELAATKKRIAPSAPGKDRESGEKPAEPVRELVAPHEWDAMLNAFEENGVTVTSEYKSAPGELEIDSEGLWERLSSTRWLKEPNGGKDSGADSSNKTTVANR